MNKLLLIITAFITAVCFASCSAPDADAHTGSTAPNTTTSATSTTTVTKPVGDPSHDHFFGGWEIIKPAACEVSGLRTRSCECGAVEEEILPPLEHTLTSHNCTDAGKCSLCGKVISDPGQHNLVGNTCTKCGTTFYTEEEIEDIIRIVNVSIYRINSAGGVSVDIGWENRSSKTVSNAYFTLRAFNASGEPASCSIRGHYDTRLSLAGPFAPGEDNYTVSTVGTYTECDSVWDNVWYNQEIASLRITALTLEYDDGSSVTLDSGYCEMALSPMTLSENAVDASMPTPQFTLTEGGGSQELSFGIVSDKGYYIRKYGMVQITLTRLNMGSFTDGSVEWIPAEVLYQQEHALSPECYTGSSGNEATLFLDLDVEGSGAIVFEIELSFTFEGEEQPTLTYKTMGNMRIIAPSE